MNRMRLRRTLLMTPGNRADRLRTAARHGADSLVFDLEDGVPAAAKAEARRCIAQVLSEPHDDGAERCVRINSLASGIGADDIAALPLALIDSIMVPKVETPADLREVQRLLESCMADRERPLEIIATLETPRGMLQALAIADACPLTSALFFGSGDYCAATGAASTETALRFARSTVAAAAGAARIQAIDAAYFQDIRNADATRADARVARELGFAGKVVFHPDQVAVVNEVFSPTAAEIERAQHIIASYRDSLARGHGTALTGGVFMAIDIVAPAERLLQRAAAIAAHKTRSR
jgi:citrate lyase subunit beta/citryl-CoA lyase